MDARNNLIRDFELALLGNDNPVNCLISVLKDYDVCVRATEIALYDDENNRMIKRFIATKKVENKADKTLKRYDRELRNLLNEIDVPLKEITAYHIRYYIADKMDKWSATTIEGEKHIYSSFFSWLLNEGYIDKNPCASLGTIKIPKVQKKAFSSTDMEEIRMVCNNPRDLALVDFLRATGCRVGEVIKVKTSDIDWINKSLFIIGKGNKEREVYLDDVAIMNIRKYLSTRSDNYPTLFVGKFGELTSNGIRTILKKIENNCNVENIHPHRFRRTLATNLMKRGMKLEEIAVLLGHDSITTTIRYCDIAQDNVHSAYTRHSA